ncbi:phosphodiester glycosidase family protein, partial [Micromonospora sp. NPDC003776]
MRTRSRSARLTGALLLTPVLTLAGPVPAGVAAPPAATATFAEDAPAASSRPDAAVALAAEGLEPAGGLDTAKTTRPVAPGLDLTSFDRYDAAGWLRADALTADLSGGVTVDYVNSGAVTRDEPLRAAVDRSRAVAAVNGDFFDINNSGAAQGVGIRSGELVQSPVAGHTNAAAISPEGLGRIIQVGFEGSAALPAGPVPLTQFNNMVQRDGVGVFTPLWGTYTRRRAVEGAARVVEVTVTGGRVATVATAAGEGPIPAGTTVLLGRE